MWCCVASRQRGPSTHDRPGRARTTNLAHQGWARTKEVLCCDKLCIVVKKKKGPSGIGVSHFQYQYSISLGPKTTLSTGTQLSIPVLTCDFCKNGRFASFHSEFPSKTQNQPQINYKTHLIPTNNISNKIFHTQLKQRGT